MNDLFKDLLDLDNGDNTHHAERTVYERAAFGMPGAKWRSLKYILPHLPVTKSSVWVDHFGGTGVVSWNVPTCNTMVYNDRFGGVVAFYRTLKNHPHKLIEAINKFAPHSREEWIDCKNMWVAETDDVERAAKWYYMVRLSVLGKGRAFGRSIKTKWNPLKSGLDVMQPLHYKLQDFYIENLDARTCFKDYDSPNTVHYFDPPYLGTDQGTYKHKWVREDMEELLTMIEGAKGYVALSHYPDAQIDKKPFWTKRYSWEVSVHAEPFAFKESNFKEHIEEISVDRPNTVECLWIKEPANG